MPRQRRVEYPGALHHVMSRGDRREDIFIDDVDRHDFIKTLAESCLLLNPTRQPERGQLTIL
jgi:REP element-mobilizing transposase RayT